MPKVPACLECNAEKAQLEHYLASVLPLVGRHRDANAAFGMTESRLAQNQRLRRELEEGRETSLIRVAPTAARPMTTLPFDGERLLSFFRFVTKGLLWHHWEIMLSEAHDVFAGTIPIANEVALAPFFTMGARPRVRGNLGSGTFHYEGSRHPEHRERSIWRFVIYDGVGMSASGGEEITCCVQLSQSLETRSSLGA